MPKPNPNDPSYKAPDEYLLPGTAAWSVAMAQDIYLRIRLVRQVDPSWWPSREGYLKALDEEE